MIRAAAYCRISSDPDDRAVGVQRQEEDCRRLADMREWQVVDVYVDNDRSAWNGKTRPEFQRLLADIAAGCLDAVIVYQSSRLTRRPAELEAFIDLHKRTGVRLVTTNGDVDLGSAAGRFMARIQGAQSASESDQISERVQRALVDVAKRGMPHGGRRPYGFAKNRIDHDEHEVAVIREVANALIGGESMRSICIRLNERGEKTVAGGRWSVSVLQRILLRPRMIGIRSHVKTGLHPAAWEPILTQAEQAQLKAIFGDPARRPSRGHPVSHLLSGVLRCGLCGHSMHYLIASGRNPATYICPVRGDGGCGRIAINAAKAEAFVESVALQMADRDAIEDTVSVPDTSRIRARMVQLSEAFAREDISWDEFAAARKILESKIADATKATAMKSSADRIRDRWHGMGIDARRDAIKALLGSITINPGQSRLFNPDRIQVDMVIRPGIWSFYR